MTQSGTRPRMVNNPAVKLDLNTVFADIAVSFNNRGVVEFAIAGDEEMKQALIFSLRDGVLTVTGKLPGVEKYGENLRVSTNNGAVKVNGVILDPSRKLKIDICIPWVSEFNVGNYTFGSMTFMTDGNGLTLNNASFINIVTGSFVDFTGVVSGMGGLIIANVTGTLVAEIRDMGGITVRNATGKNTVTVSGMGEFNSLALSGTLVAVTSGSAITSKLVDLTSADIQILGMGNVEFEKGTIGNLKVITTDIGAFRFEGNSTEVSIQCNGLGGATMKDISRKLTAEICDMGGITVGNVFGNTKVTVTGSGNFESTVLTGTLVGVSGSGKIVAKSVNLTAAVIHVPGMSNVELKSGTIGDLTVKTTDMGSFIFGGGAKVGSFSCHGMGDIKLKSCDKVLSREKTDMGNIRIG
jgi:hypothetical protein